jgi:hypothetical protein
VMMVMIGISRCDATEGHGNKGCGEKSFFHETSYRSGCGVKIVAGFQDGSSDRTEHICLLFDAPKPRTFFEQGVEG